MKIGIIGTGVVGRSLAEKLADLGHEVTMGTRDTKATLARNAPDNFGNPPFAVWLKQHPKVKLATFADAAAQGEIILNATNGFASMAAMKLAGESNLDGKILMDISNPLDFSKGMPPSLFICNTDSLGEQIQRAYPRTKVVKTLNTVTARVMTNPGQVAGGDHHVFVGGNDAAAKAKVTEILKTWFGWKNVIDLGDITSSRGVEMILPVWVRLMGVMKTPLFNFKIVQ